MMKSLRVETCEFQRAKLSPWERGIIVNEGDGPIIDMLGLVVAPPIMNWRPIPESVMTVANGITTKKASAT